MSNRAARRRAEKQAAKPVTTPVARGQSINLQNPVAEHFATFITTNAGHWQVRALVELQDVMPPDEYEVVVEAFNTVRLGMVYQQSAPFRDALTKYLPGHFVLQEGSATGQHLVLCGAGPTLRDHAAEWCHQGDQVWGCNSAATWLHDNGHKVTHGFTVDQTAHMVQEWASAPDIDYLLASTVHPHLTDYLYGHARRVTFFHNFVGIKEKPIQWPDENGVLGLIPYEDWLYAVLYPPTQRAGSGLNAVTRALDIAQFMGFEKITVLGADCCMQVTGKPRPDLALGSPEQLAWLREHTVMHADGGHALASEASPMTLSATIDGRYWLTKVDMSITAQWLMRMATASNGRIQLIGDTLPNAFMGKGEEWLSRLPNFVDSAGNIANIPSLEHFG